MQNAFSGLVDLLDQFTCFSFLRGNSNISSR